VCSGVAEKAAEALFDSTVKQDVGEDGAGLAFPRRQSRHTVREMQPQTSVRRQHQHVVISASRSSALVAVVARKACAPTLKPSAAE
jgi:hypothetical protein